MADPLTLNSASGSKTYHFACGALLALSLFGIGLSLWIHIDAWAGLGWTERARNIWVWQLMLITTLLPIGVEVVRTKDYRHILEPPRRIRRILWMLAAYYTASFYLFVYRAADYLSAAEAWEVFSAGMMLAFAIAASHYASRFSRTNTLVRKKNSESTLPSP